MVKIYSLLRFIQSRQRSFSSKIKMPELSPAQLATFQARLSLRNFSSNSSLISIYIRKTFVTYSCEITHKIVENPWKVWPSKTTRIQFFLHQFQCLFNPKSVLKSEVTLTKAIVTLLGGHSTTTWTEFCHFWR